MIRGSAERQKDVTDDVETMSPLIKTQGGVAGPGLPGTIPWRSHGNPRGQLRPRPRFQVRIWMVDDATAKKVATIYNTRGDKVNDSTAKCAYSETKEQEFARRLVNGSEHLGQDNVEVLSNSVSASSHKLTAFNIISRAIETSWQGGPVTAADAEAQSSWLISAWDSLVKVRPEYGKLSTPARQAQRSNTIASSAVVIYGFIGAMSAMHTDHIDPDSA